MLMSGGRWAVIGVLLVAVAAGSMALVSTEVRPSSAPRKPEPTRDEPKRDRSADRARRRALEAAARYVSAHESPRRAVAVRVAGCGLEPVAGARVFLDAGPGREPTELGSTDASGGLGLEVADGDEVILVAEHAEHGAGMAKVGRADTQLEVQICAGATVLGRVVDEAGRPVAGVAVQLTGGADFEVTDEIGEFVLTDLYLTAKSVEARLEGRVAKAEVPPLSPQESWEVTLRLPEVILVGWVVDEEDQPVSHLEVVALDAEGTVLARTRADRNGQFWIKPVPSSVDRVALEAGQPFVGEEAVWLDASTEITVVARRSDGPSVAGTLVAPGGILLAGVPVSLKCHTGGGWNLLAKTSTDEQGVFELSDLPTDGRICHLELEHPAMSMRRYLPDLTVGQRTDLGPIVWALPEQEGALRVRAPFGGIGASIFTHNDWVRVGALADQSPLLDAGVQPGDAILRMGALDLTKIRLQDAVLLLRGEVGTTLDLLVEHQGEQRWVTVRRALIDPSAFKPPG
jgi:hypothetical protein